MNRLESWGGRKFVLAVLTLAAASLLVAFKAIGEASWVTAITATVGAFMLSNAGQKVGLGFAARPATAATAPETPQ